MALCIDQSIGPNNPTGSTTHALTLGAFTLRVFITLGACWGWFPSISGSEAVALDEALDSRVSLAAESPPCCGSTLAPARVNMISSSKPRLHVTAAGRRQGFIILVFVVVEVLLLQIVVATCISSIH
jgi:hypothetical protein